MRVRRPALQLLAVGLATLAACLVGAANAHAGTYIIRNCNVPGYATAPITPWTASLVPNVASFNTCASGGGFGMIFPGPRVIVASAQPRFDLVEPDAIDLRRIRLWMTTRLSGTGQPLIGLAFAINASGPFAAYASYPPGASTLAVPVDSDITDDATAYRLSLACGFGSQATDFDCKATEAVPFEVRGVEITLEENVIPAGSVNGGTLFTDGPVAGKRSVDYAVFDGQSGIKSVQVSIGSALVATKDLSGSCTYADFAACPKVDSDTLEVDTTQVTDGTQPVTFRVTDAADNHKTFQVQLINVDNVRDAPAGPTATGVDGEMELTARFSRSKRASMIIPFRRRVTVRGQLSAASKPVVGARIDVMQRSGTKEKRVGKTTTRSDGTFTYRRSVRGPTRTLRFLYSGEPGSAGASSRILKLRVRASASLRVSLRGRTLRFRGRVLSRPLPKKGKRIRLQGRTPGFAWATFAKRRTDRGGRFSGNYRLPVRRPGVRLQIRAWIPGERGYRYLSYRGGPRKLRVR